MHARIVWLIHRLIPHVRELGQVLKVNRDTG